MRDLLPGQCKNYLSIDSMLDKGNETDYFYDPEFLNSISLSGLLMK